MPKKTRREKILADARRIIREAQQNQPPQKRDASGTPKPNTVSSTDIYQFKSSKPVISKPASSVTDEAEFAVIRKNLLKTILLAGVAIAVEFILYLRIGR